MDQIKVGKFIAACRKEQGMTQANLAEKLGISDRAVSKWETGKSMPDSGIMLELCELLKINVNELLSGERIMAESYDKRAEENLLEMKRQVEEKNMFDYVEHHTPAIMEELGIPMYFSKGCHSNIKITEKEDVDMFLGYQLAKKYNEMHNE